MLGKVCCGSWCWLAGK